MSALAEDWQDVEPFHTTETLRRIYAPGCNEYRPVLDHRSDDNPMLRLTLNEVLTEIMMISDGAVAALKIRVAGSKDPVEPRSFIEATIESIFAEYEQCRTHRQRIEVIKAARLTALRLQFAPRRAIRGEDEWKQEIVNDPRPYRVLVGVYGVSLGTIASIKKQGRVQQLAKSGGVQ